jgi:hypothetical protein
LSNCGGNSSRSGSVVCIIVVVWLYYRGVDGSVVKVVKVVGVLVLVL